VVGVVIVGVGLYAAFRPEKAVQLTYRWRQGWIRLLSLGKVEAPPPPFSDQTSKWLMLVVSVVLIVVGFGLLVGSLVAL
jgi:hypothetical protein